MTGRPTRAHLDIRRPDPAVGDPDLPAPVVTVVIPTYNRARLLPRALDSVLGQSWQDLEILVVDDGSTDQTAEVVADYQDPRVRLLSLGDRGGAARARNIGIRAARAEWVAFLDSDDEWLPPKLDAQLARVRDEDGRVAAVYCRWLTRDHFTGRAWPRWTPLHEGDVFDALVRGRFMPTTSVVMARRAHLLAVGGFDETLPSCQDYDLCLRLARAGHRFVGVDAVLVVKHQHRGAQITADGVARARGLQALDAKWGDVIRERFGRDDYRKWRAYHQGALPYAQFMQVRTAVATGDRAAAWRLCRAGWSGPGSLRWRFGARAVAVTLLGRRVYGLLARLHGALVRLSWGRAPGPPAPVVE